MTQTLTRLKKPFGTAKMVDLTAVRYLAWEDAFEVDFEDGLTFLEPHSTIRKANKISAKVEVEGGEEEKGWNPPFFPPPPPPTGGSRGGVSPPPPPPTKKKKSVKKNLCFAASAKKKKPRCI